MTAEYWSMPRIAVALMLLGMLVTSAGLVALLVQGTIDGVRQARRMVYES